MLRDETLNFKRPNPSPRSCNGTLSYTSHVRNRTGKPDLDYTDHELNSFAKVINVKKDMDFIIRKSAMSKNEKLSASVRKSGKDAWVILSHHRNIKQYTLLTNNKLYRLMEELNIWSKSNL